jgi:hypothetical protein
MHKEGIHVGKIPMPHDTVQSALCHAKCLVERSVHEYATRQKIKKEARRVNSLFKYEKEKAANNQGK